MKTKEVTRLYQLSKINNFKVSLIINSLLQFKYLARELSTETDKCSF